MDFESYKTEWRSFLFILGLFTQIRQQIGNCIDDNFAITCLSRNKYLSVQVNYFVIIWLGLFLLWRNDEMKLDKITGKIQGALVGYITLVWLAYWALLSATDNPSGWGILTNLVIHYILPISFIVDWLVYENKQYSWKYLPQWVIYPLMYLAFIFINGSLGLDLGYIYTFMDPTGEEGWGSVGLMVVILLVAYLFLATIYIILNKLIVKSEES